MSSKCRLDFTCIVFIWLCSIVSLQAFSLQPRFELRLVNKKYVRTAKTNLGNDFRLFSSQNIPNVSQNTRQGDGAAKTNTILKLQQFIVDIWDFSRPHTLVGSALSLVSLYMFSSDRSQWLSSNFFSSLLLALIPSLLMNIYITGLNQITDVDIDRINKPYLPIASGRFSVKTGTIIILSCLTISLVFASKSDYYLRATLLGSGLLGTVYSLPPFRLKRFPLLAAICILVVRGSLVNLGFFFSGKLRVMKQNVSLSLFEAAKSYPESVMITVFFAIFGVVIALMKDVPDVNGDVVGKISSFSVQFGPRRMLRLARVLLLGLLSSAGIAMLRFGTMSASSVPTAVCRGIVGLGLLALGLDIRRRGKIIDAQEGKAVFEYYMHVWKIFYACYIMLPFIR